MNMTPPLFRAPRSILITSIALLSPFLIVPANAGVIWDGGGADDNWGTGANWSPDGPPPVGPTVDLTFDGTTRLTPFNNYTAFDDFHSLFFAATAGQFNVGGNAIDLFGKIENYSTVTQTVSLASLGISAGQAGTGEFNPVSGDLVINSANVFTNGNALHVYGSNNRTVTFGAGTVISQGGSFAIEQANTVVFQSAHTYSGDTFVNAGTLAFAAGGSVDGSIIRLGGTAADSGAATVSLTATAGAQTLASTLVVRPSASGTQGTRTIASQNTSGTNTLSGGVFLDADLTTSATAGGTLAFTGSAFDLKNQTLTVGGAGNTSISGALQNSTGSGKLTKTGNGTLTLSGANTFTGLVSINGGAVNVASWNLSGAAGVWGAAANNSGAPATTFIQMNGGRINYTGTAASGDLRGVNLVSGNNTIDIITGSTLTFGGAFNRFQSNGGNLIKEGGGTLQIGSSGIANNVFTGKVTINAGALDWFGAGSMPSPGALVSDFITINNGAKFQLTYPDAPTTVSANIGFKVSDSAGIEIVGNHTIAGVIANGANPGSVIKTGAGNLTLSGANTYTGGTIVNAGRLQFGAGAGSVPATGNVTINASGVLAATGPAGFTTAGLWAGSGRIAAASSGVLALPANDSSNVDFSSTSSLFLGTTGNFTYSGTLTPGSNGFRLGGGGGTLTVSSALTGAAALTSVSAVTLSGANTYTGATNVNAGTLKAGVASVADVSGAFGKNSAVNLSNVAAVALDITGFNTQIGSLTGGGATGGNVTLGAATLTLGGDNTSPAAYAGVISGVGGAVTKIGTGTQILTASNTFTGALTVEAGTLSVPAWNNNSTNGPLGNSTLPVTLGSATTQGTLRFTGGGSNNVPATIKPLSLAAGGGKVEMVYSAGNRGGNFIHINGDRITGSGGLTVDTFAGGATSRFIVVGSAPYTGPTVVAAGSELQTNYDVAGDGTPFGSGANGLGSAVTVNAGGLLTFFSFNNTRTIALGSLAGAGTVQGEGGGTHTFKIGGDDTSTAFSGIFQNNGGPVAVTKVGTGTLTLSGASTHTGLFAINGGAISVPTWNLSGAAGPWGAVANNTGAPATTFIQMNGGRINYTGPSATGNLRGVNLASGNNTIDIITGSTLNFAGGGSNTFQSNGGNLIKEGGGTLQLGSDGIANNVFTGKVTLNAGTLEWFGAGSMPAPAALVSDFITINNGAKFQLTYPAVPTTVPVNIGFNVAGSAGIHVVGNHTIAGVIANGASAGGVTKTGNGTLTLSNANTYTGATAVNDGTLSLTGTLSGTSITVSGASTVFAQAGASVIAGTGSTFTVNGGTATIPGVNTFTGAVTVADGTLITNNWNNDGTDGPLGNSALPVTLGGASTMGTLRYTGGSFLPDNAKKGLSLNAGGGTVQLSIGANRSSFAHLNGSSITGSGGLTVQTDGARFLIVGSAAYTGPTVVAASSELQANYYDTVNDGTPFGAGTNGLGSPVTVGAGSFLTLYSAGANTTVAIGSLSGTGTVRGEHFGTHTLKTGGDNSSTTFSGVIADSFDNPSPTALTKVGTGTQTFSGVNTYTGATLVTAGTLLVSGSISGSTVTVDGGTLGGSGGTVGATTVNSGGTFAPGASIGTLNVSGTLALGGTAAFELNKSGFTLSADLANVTGALTLGGTLNVTATGDTLTPGDSFNLFDAASFAGSFATLNLPSLTLDYSWDTTALSTDGSIVVVPEPGAIISLLSGLGILAAFRRRRA